MQSSTPTHSNNNNNNNNDKIVYFGVININENGRNIGAIDIWRSVITKKMFCEEKRIGILDITEKIGMPEINEQEIWAVAVNKFRKGKDRWKLITTIKDGKINFLDTDDESQITANVVNFKIIDQEWWSFLVSDNVNKSIEISEEMK